MPPTSSSSNHQGNSKDALTCQASFLVSSYPGTVNSSIHQLGVSHLSTFQQTHSARFETGGSGGIFSPSSSEISGDPCRKEATASLSSGGSPKSESLPSHLPSPKGILGSADHLGASSSIELTWRCLFFCPSPLDLQ